MAPCSTRFTSIDKRRIVHLILGFVVVVVACLLSGLQSHGIQLGHPSLFVQQADQMTDVPAITL